MPSRGVDDAHDCDGEEREELRRERQPEEDERTLELVKTACDRTKTLGLIEWIAHTVRSATMATSLITGWGIALALSSLEAEKAVW